MKPSKRIIINAILAVGLARSPVQAYFVTGTLSTTDSGSNTYIECVKQIKVPSLGEYTAEAILTSRDPKTGMALKNESKLISGLTLEDINYLTNDIYNSHHTSWVQSRLALPITSNQNLSASVGKYWRTASLVYFASVKTGENENIVKFEKLNTFHISLVATPVLESSIILGHLLPVLGEVDQLLLNIPSALTYIGNGLIDRWNLAISNARAKKAFNKRKRDTLSTEQSITKLLMLVSKAQTIQLMSMACDDTKEKILSAKLVPYLSDLTLALEQFNEL